MYITAYINSALAFIICVSWHIWGKGERKGANWGKYTSASMLHSSILRRRRRSRKEGLQGEKEIVQGVCSQNDTECSQQRRCPEDDGDNGLLDTKISCNDSMMQTLQRRLGLKRKAVICRKRNKSLKSYCAKPAVIRVGLGGGGRVDRGTPD